jgi:hypothetical protein
VRLGSGFEERVAGRESRYPIPVTPPLDPRTRRAYRRPGRVTASPRSDRTWNPPSPNGATILQPGASPLDRATRPTRRTARQPVSRAHDHPSPAS